MNKMIMIGKLKMKVSEQFYYSIIFTSSVFSLISCMYQAYGSTAYVRIVLCTILF